MNELKIIDENILIISENSLVQLLLFGDPKYNLIDNCQTLNASINFTLKSERFKGSIVYICLPIYIINCFSPFVSIFVALYIFVSIYIVNDSNLCC